MKKSAVEWLAEKYNYIEWMLRRDEISPATADEWRFKFLNEAKEMEKKQIVTAYDLAYMDSFVDDVCKNDKPNDGEAFYDWYYGQRLNLTPKINESNP